MGEAEERHVPCGSKACEAPAGASTCDTVGPAVAVEAAVETGIARPGHPAGAGDAGVVWEPGEAGVAETVGLELSRRRGVVPREALRF